MINLTEKAIINLIELTLHEKMEKDENFIKYSFYEVNVKYHLNPEEKSIFLLLLKTKLKNNNYKIYLEGQKYIYQGIVNIVEKNETLIAIKNK